MFSLWYFDTLWYFSICHHYAWFSGRAYIRYQALIVIAVASYNFREHYLGGYYNIATPYIHTLQQLLTWHGRHKIISRISMRDILMYAYGEMHVPLYYLTEYAIWNKNMPLPSPAVPHTTRIIGDARLPIRRFSLSRHRFIDSRLRLMIMPFNFQRAYEICHPISLHFRHRLESSQMLIIWHFYGSNSSTISFLSWFDRLCDFDAPLLPDRLAFSTPPPSISLKRRNELLLNASQWRHAHDDRSSTSFL